MVHAFRRSIPAALGLLVAAPLAWAADLHVPSQYPTIQAAIVAAGPGDRVLVQPGAYAETIDFVGKGVEVIGVGGAAVTTIDATGLASSCAMFMMDEPPQAVLRGFTLTGGTGSTPGFGPLRGGGVHITSGSRPVIRECVITGNTAIDGGGVHASVLWSDTSAALFQDCVIFGNEATHSGGGVEFSFTGTVFPPFGETAGQPVFRNCTITDNVAASAGGGVAGGGVFIDCLIADNVADLGGGAYQVLWFQRTTLSGNSAEYGGGYYGTDDDHCVLSGATFLENTASERGGGAFLEAFEWPEDAEGFSEPKSVSAAGCIFARNSGPQGDGLYVFGQQSSTTISGCTFDGDRLDTAGGMLTVLNSISRGVATAFTALDTIVVRFSDVEGGWSGPGNIDADPLWVDAPGGDYSLQGCSPCIDAGDPLAPLEIDGTVVDMGGVPFRTWTDLGGGVPGLAGSATLLPTGLLLPSTPLHVALSGAAPSTPVWLVVGVAALGAPFKGGTLWPAPTLVVGGLLTSPAGSLSLDATWPSSIPCGFSLYLQAWWPDAGADFGFAGSNGMRGVTR